MSEAIESRTERRTRRQRRRTGLIGMGILASSVAATVALLLLGPATARGAVVHPTHAGTPRAAATAGAR